MDNLKRSVTKNFTKLFSSSVIAKFILLLSIPLITRYVTPEEFGRYTFFNSLLYFIAPLASLRLIDAIPIPKSTLHASQIFTLSFICSLCFGTLALITSFIFIDYIQSIYNFIDVSFLILLTLSLVFQSLYEGMHLWTIRRRNYSKIGNVQILQSIVGNGVKVLFSYLNIPMGLLIGQFFQVASGFSMLFKGSNNPYHMYKKRFSKKLLYNIFFGNNDYVKYKLPSQILLGFSMLVPVIFLGKYYDAAELGFYGLAYSVVTSPLILVAGNIRKIFYGECSKIGIDRPNDLKAFTQKTIFLSFLLSLPIFIFLFFCSETVFDFMFGAEWQTAGKYAAYLSIYVIGFFSVGSVVDIFNIIGKQKVFFLINLLRLIVVILVFIYGANIMNAQNVILTYSITLLIFYFLIMFFIYYYLNRIIRKKLK